ncbi:unnamed protein product [Pleuronectes platessa]|uniref:Uncharacterized protein n=1 Tax=Pleuronectes platessa TaxID=8262 RepID=A0A9N7TS07_PLEPL|nr:unnamed protein product [Pleuronectes platessa]
MGAAYNKANKDKWQLLNHLSGEAKMAIYISRKNRVENRDGQEAGRCVSLRVDEWVGLFTGSRLVPAQAGRIRGRFPQLLRPLSFCHCQPDLQPDSPCAALCKLFFCTNPFLHDGLALHMIRSSWHIAVWGEDCRQEQFVMAGFLVTVAIPSGAGSSLHFKILRVQRKRTTMRHTCERVHLWSVPSDY